MDGRTHTENKPDLYYARRSYFAPTKPLMNRNGGIVVEAPGTAPGSVTLIL